MRIMGLDFGSKTVGVAISDPLFLTAQGIEIVRRKAPGKLRQTLARINELKEEYEVGKIVLGFPKNMNNTEGERCEKTLEFKEMLEKRTGLEVVLWDERLTTVEADRTMMQVGIRRENRKEYVDDDVLRLIQMHMKTVLDTEKMIQEMNAASKNQTQYLLLDKEVGKLRRELSRISKRKSDLYEDYSERLITEEEYIQFSRIYSNEIENIKSRLDTVLAAQVRYSQDYHIEEGWGNVIHTYMSKRKLTKEMADAFVDSIIIHGKYDYEIKLVYDDQFADLQKLKKEKEAQSR